MRSITNAFKEPQGILYHGLALLYALIAYALGIVGLFAQNALINAAATLLLAHGMIIAAYLIHECAHNTIFRANDNNAQLGKLLSWLCGAAYGTYEDIRYKHFRHHVDNDDPVWFDYETFFSRHPILLRTVKFLEWCYVPAHDLVMHFIMVFSSFIIPQRRQQRLYNVTVIIIRGSVFLCALYWYPKVALLYMVAYMIMIQVLRFMDSLQHDYSYSLRLFGDERSVHKGDKIWEQEHTFSNPHSLKIEWLNWLTLNFGFHNAHHSRPTSPWYRLPALHKKLYGDDENAVIPVKSQLRIFHKRRVARVMHDGAPDLQGEDYLVAAQQGLAYGGNAVSFLTAF